MPLLQHNCMPPNCDYQCHLDTHESIKHIGYHTNFDLLNWFSYHRIYSVSHQHFMIYYSRWICDELTTMGVSSGNDKKVVLWRCNTEEGMMDS